MKPSKTLILAALSLTLTLSSALAGKEGGGGDFRAIRFVKMGEHIVKYLEQREASAPGIVSSRISIVALKKAIVDTDVESTNKKLSRDGSPKDALNYPELKRIVFNRDEWDSLADNQTKSILVLHEYLGIIKVEADTRPYPISGGLLGDDFVKNWPVLPKLLSDGGCSPDEDTLEANRERAERVARASASGLFANFDKSLTSALNSRSITGRLMDELNSPSLMRDQIGVEIARMQENGRNRSRMRRYVNRELAECFSLFFKTSDLRVSVRRSAPGQYLYRISIMTADGYSGGYAVKRFNFEMKAKAERKDDVYVVSGTSMPLLTSTDEIDCYMRDGGNGKWPAECSTGE